MGQSTYWQSPDGNAWSPAVPTDSPWAQSIVYANGIYVAAGWSGIYTSPDGVSWTWQSTGSAWSFTSVTYGNGLFVAPEASGCWGFCLGAVIYTSPDGVTWTPQQTALFGQIWDVTYGNNVFVGVGDMGLIATSVDGITWVPQFTNEGYPLYGVKYGNGIFMAVGAYQHVLTSLDGAVFITQYTGPWWDALWSAAYGAGTWVVVGDWGMVMRSVDNGATWTVQSPGTAYNPYFTNVAYGGGQFIAVAGWSSANATSGSTATITSPDGITWTSRTANAYANWYALYDLIHVGGQWLAIGESVVRSSDGIEWTANNAYALYVKNAVAHNGTHWVSVGRHGSVATSANGQDWVSRYSGATTTTEFWGLSWAQDKWVAVGSGGAIRTSLDGKAWTARTSGTAQTLYAVAYGPGQWLAVGASGTMVSSPDGITWSSVAGASSTTLRGVSYGGGNWTAVGLSGTIQTSPTGISGTWTSRAVAGVTQALHAVAWDLGASGDKWVAVGASGRFLRSADSATWTAGTQGTSTYNAVAREGTNWVATGSGTIRSTDAVTWSTLTNTGTRQGIAHSTPRPLECGPTFQTVVTGEEAFVGGVGGRWPYTITAAGSNATDPVVAAAVKRTYATVGLYTVSVVDAATPAVTATCTVEVVPPPPPLLVCSPTLVVTDIDVDVVFSASGGVPPYTWSIPNGTVAATNATSTTASFAAGGSHNVTLTDSAVPPQSATCDVIAIAPEEEEEDGDGDGGGDEGGDGDGSGGGGGAPAPETRSGLAPDPNRPQPAPSSGGRSQSVPAPPAGPPAGEAAPAMPDPVADAGADLAAIGGDRVTLDGSASAMEGSPQHRWRQVSGPAVVLHAAATAAPWFVAPDADGPLVFELEVTDAAGRTATDLVVVQVQRLTILAQSTGDLRMAFQSNMPGLRHEWEFGDGATAEGADVEHAYGRAGTYTVSLMAFDAQGTARFMQQEVDVAAPPAGDGAPPVATAIEAAAAPSVLLPVSLLAAVALVLGVAIAVMLRKPRRKR